MREEETLENLNFAEELKTIDICAIGPLRTTAALLNAGLLKEGSKIVMITSQGGSVSWRTTQNPQGHDYGHHVSFARRFLPCGRGVTFKRESCHLSSSYSSPISSCSAVAIFR